MECQECGQKFKPSSKMQPPKGWPKDGLVLTNINVEGEGPLRFKSKRELSTYCNKHGLSSGALL
jgi:hypothetical protein